MAEFRVHAAGSTECLAYHLTPEGEDRHGMWARYAEALTRSGYTAAIGTDLKELTSTLGTGMLPDVTIIEAGSEEVRRVLDSFDRLPDDRHGILLAVALGGGGNGPVSGDQGALGASGALLLRSAWTPGDWVSEEVFDHTSLLRLCERWTTDRGHPVPADVAGWRRELCGDLLGVIDLQPEADGGPFPTAQGRRLARPVPYFPVADLRVGETAAVLRLGNIGPVARSAAPFTVLDGAAMRHLIVPDSPSDDQHHVRVPVEIRDGGYDVTVRGPDHFHRRFAGRLLDADVHCAQEHGGRDPWFPGLTLQVWHDRMTPIFFWMQRRLGERAASKAAGYGAGTVERLPGPRQTARFKEEPGANTFGWYDVSVTTSADPTWVREYAGHLPTGLRPTLGY